MISKQQLQQIAIAMVTLAKSELNDEQFNLLPIPLLQPFVVLMAEAVPVNHLTDSVLLRHAIHQLIAGSSMEQTVMHVFTLSIFRMTSEGSNHPLERGIIRQKIIGILPVFENALNQGLINIDIYDRNADALAHIAEGSDEIPDILAALSAEYLRLKP
jgi:hypothetical protein